MPIKRIVLTGDVFRTSAGEANQLGNVKWLHRRFAAMLYRLTGLKPEICFRNNAPNEGRAVIQNWYNILGVPMGIKGWAQSFWSIPTAELISAMSPDYQDSLVISVEMSPLMIGVLDALDIPWIDVGISPKRFLADLIVTLKSSRHFNTACRPDLLLNTEELTYAVEFVRSHYKTIDTSSLDGASVFFAQTLADRTLIHEGRMPEAREIFDQVTKNLNNRRLVIKPHPLAMNNPVLRMLQQEYSAQICDINTYAIVSSLHNVAALTWSSSVGLEAQAFGLPSLSFSPKVQKWSYGGVETLKWGRSAKLWGALLSQILPVVPTEDDEPWRCNDLRNDLGSFGFNATIWPAATAARG